MSDMTPNEIEMERKLKGIRLTTSAALDERMRSLIESSKSAHDAGAPGDSAPAPILHARRTWLKAGLGLAAALLLAVAARWYFGNGHTVPLVRSAYAELLEAYENTKAAEWVHFTGTMGDQSLESWMSLDPYRCFTKLSDGTIAAADIDSRRMVTYDPKSGALTVQYEEFSSMKGRGNLLEMMMSQLLEEEKYGKATIAREQQTVEGKDVSVVTGDLPDDKIRIRLFIDPDDKRLTRAEVFSLDSTPAAQLIRAFDVDYPETGPADIYALGVPRDAKIVDKMGDSGFINLRDEALRARDRFIGTYTAVRAQMRMDSDGTLRPDIVFIIYKKNGAYRIERVWLVQDLMPNQGAHPVLPDTLEGYLQWARSRPVQSVVFYSSDGAKTRTTVEMRTPDELVKESDRNWTHPPSFSVENDAWGDIQHISPNQTAKTEVLPLTAGAFGPLVGIRQTWQGYVDKDGHVYPPSQSDYCFNPDRGWILERKTTVWERNAPWQQDKDWLTGNDPNAATTEHSRSERLVEEYGQTADGDWYPARILETSQETVGETTSDSRYVILIYLDTTIEIPDDFMDPDSVLPDRFNLK